MLNSNWLAVPFILQMLCMAADEFWFHRKRGLPRWERIGHPLDTLTVVLCLAWILCVQPTHQTVMVWVVLAIFSCVFVTKDEVVHWRRCSAGEQWLHALLFTLHPLVLASAAFVWPAIGSAPPLGSLHMIRFSGFERTFLAFICRLMIGFGVYQFVFWNLLWRPKKSTP
jgi:hypothetical protein